MKNIKFRKNRKGFTLVELLLVMAIIGILAGIIMIGMSSSRKRSKVTAALETANSVKSELAHCYLNNATVDNWGNASTGGGTICPGAGDWPDLSKTKCTYGGYTSTHILTINCPDNDDATITCNIPEGKCEVTYP